MFTLIKYQPATARESLRWTDGHADPYLCWSEEKGWVREWGRKSMTVYHTREGAEAAKARGAGECYVNDRPEVYVGTVMGSHALHYFLSECQVNGENRFHLTAQWGGGSFHSASRALDSLAWWEGRGLCAEMCGRLRQLMQLPEAAAA